MLPNLQTKQNHLQEVPHINIHTMNFQTPHFKILFTPILYVIILAKLELFVG